MKAKTISFADLWTFRHCRACYLERIDRRRPLETVSEIVGAATHAGVAVPQSERDAIVARHVRYLTESQRLEAERLIRQHICTNERFSAQSPYTEPEREKQLSWLDGESGWTLKAKPDEIGFIPDSNGNQVVQITDLKTAYLLRPKHKAQLYFFGLVAHFALNHTGPIKLVVRLLGSQREHIFWYSHLSTQGSLAKIRETTREIEKFLSTDKDAACRRLHSCRKHDQMAIAA